MGYGGWIREMVYLVSNGRNCGRRKEGGMITMIMIM
jgi:hypothetical protein